MSTTADVDLQDSWTCVSPPLRPTGHRRAVVGVMLPGIELDPVARGSAQQVDPAVVNTEFIADAAAIVGAETVVSVGDVSAVDAVNDAGAVSVGQISSTPIAIPGNGAGALGTGGVDDVDIVTLVLRVSIDPSASHRRSRDVTWTCDVCNVTVTSRLAGAVESLGEHAYRHHHRGAESFA